MIEWDEKYSVSVKELDDQHKIFFELINKLESLMTHKTLLVELPLLLNEIVEYTTLHFSTEEALMEKVNYPDLKEHQEEHHHLKKEIYLKCIEVIEKKPTTLDVIWLYNYMKEWLETHILEADHQYAPYMKNWI